MSNEINENIAVEVEEVPEMNLVEETEEMDIPETHGSDEPLEYEEPISGEVLPATNGGSLGAVASGFAGAGLGFAAGFAAGRLSAKKGERKPKEPKEPGEIREAAMALRGIHKDHKERRKAKKEAKKALKEAAKAEVTNEEK